jgi:hypothetical protein
LFTAKGLNYFGSLLAVVLALPVCAREWPACESPLLISQEIVVPVDSFFQHGFSSCWAQTTTAVLEHFVRKSRSVVLDLSADALLTQHIWENTLKMTTPFNGKTDERDRRGRENILALLNGTGNHENEALDLWKRVGFIPKPHYRWHDSRHTMRESLELYLHDVDFLIRSSQNYSERWLKRWEMDQLNKYFGLLPATLSPPVAGEDEPHVLADKIMGTAWRTQLHWAVLFRHPDLDQPASGLWLQQQKLRKEDRPHLLRAWWNRRKLRQRLETKAASESALARLSAEMKKIIDEKGVLQSSLYWMQDMIQAQAGHIEHRPDSVSDLSSLMQGLSLVHSVVVNGYRINAQGQITHWRIQEGSLPGFDGKGSHWVSTEYFERRVIAVRELSESKSLDPAVK